MATTTKKERRVRAKRIDTGKTKSKRRVVKYQPSFVIDIYEMTRDGMTNKKICQMLGIGNTTLHFWCDRHPLFKVALDRGRAKNKRETTTSDMREYVYNRLPPELQELWTKLAAIQDEPNAVSLIEGLLADRGKSARQWMFLQAMIRHNYNISRACATVNISSLVVRGWAAGDSDFCQLLDEIKFHRAEFYESALVGRVRAGDTQAIVFANKTFNKSRGYGERLDVVMEGQIDHNHIHTHIAIDELSLDIPTRRTLLAAIRATTKEKALEQTPIPQAIGS